MKDLWNNWTRDWPMYALIVLIFFVVTTFCQIRRTANYKAINAAPIWQIQGGKVLVRTDCAPEEYQKEIVRVVEIAVSLENQIKQGKK